MINTLFHWNNLFTLILLIGFELVLGVDNVLIISLIVAPLSTAMRQRARMIGLLLALILRLLFVAGAFWLVQWTTPLFFHFSPRDIVLVLGGLFLMGKASKELYCLIEHQEAVPDFSSSKKTLSAVVMQILMLDLIFSIDSVITAVGLTSMLLIIFIAVIFSFVALLFYIGPVGEFILRHRSLKMMALLFLGLLGASFIAEGFHHPIPKAFLYGVVAFSLALEALQARYRFIQKKSHAKTSRD